MRILVTTGDFSRYLTPNFHNLLTEAAKHAEIITCHESGDINEIIKYSGRIPDFVFINEFQETNSPRITGLASLPIPYGIQLHDLHFQMEARKKLIVSEKVAHIFVLYRDRFCHWYPEFRTLMHWLPHHVDTNLFKDYGMKKDINYLFMGAVHPVIYPLRYKILRSMQGKSGFVCHEHPGYKNFSDEERARLYIGENYAREINRAKIFLTCDSTYHYSLAKYFEVLACKTLLLAPCSNEFIDLGFMPGEHFVAITEDDFMQKAEYYLRHEEERIQIAEQGYRMVRKRHSTTRRAIEWLAMIRKILKV